MKARELLGKSVHDREGTRLGRIEDLVVDRITGRVLFAAVALDADARRCLPIPWSALTTRRDGGEIRLRIDDRRIAGAPRIDPGELDALRDRDLKVEVFSYYGLQPPGEGTRARRAIEGPDPRNENV